MCRSDGVGNNKVARSAQRNRSWNPTVPPERAPVARMSATAGIGFGRTGAVRLHRRRHGQHAAALASVAQRVGSRELGSTSRRRCAFGAASLPTACRRPPGFGPSAKAGSTFADFSVGGPGPEGCSQDSYRAWTDALSTRRLQAAASRLPERRRSPSRTLHHR